MLGMAQIIATAAVIALTLMLFHFSTKSAIIIGSGLSLSSTALVMQLLTEHNKKASQIGRISLAILAFTGSSGRAITGVDTRFVQ